MTEKCEHSKDRVCVHCWYPGMNEDMPTHHISKESAVRLKELGCPQKSMFYWIPATTGIKTIDSKNIEQFSDSDFFLIRDDQPLYEDVPKISAFISSELGELLPFQIKYKNMFCYLSCEKNIPDYGGWICCYESSDIIRPTMNTEIFTADTEAEARALMLIYLAENHLISFKD